jgi:hemolysin activation/secretion protein
MMRFSSLVLGLVLLACPARAQDLRNVQPPPVPPQVAAPPVAEPSSSAVAPAADLGPLRGIVVLSDPSQVRAEGLRDVTGVDFSHAPALRNATAEAVLQGLLGRPLDEHLINTLRVLVPGAYAGRGAGVVRLSLPPQEVIDGVVQILLYEARLGTVKIDGAKWFSEKNYLALLGARSGADYAPAELDAGVARINRNPFRRAVVELVPGAEAGLADVVLRTNEAFPWRVTAGYNDTGTIATGENRVTLGIDWGNAFGLAHQLSYQLMASPGANYFRSHSVSYQGPRFFGGDFSANASYSIVNSRMAPPFAQRGESSAFTLRHAHVLPAWRGVEQGWTVGLDYKRSDNNLEFSAVPIFGTLTESFEGVLDYQASRRDRLGSAHFGATLTLSPGGVTDHNTTNAFRAQRAGASARYAKVALTLGRETSLPAKFGLNNSLRAQFATDNLLGSGQLAFGGSSALRGYEEGEIYTDEGLALINELQLPPVTFGHGKRAGQVLPHLFWDYGYGLVKDPLPGEQDSFSLSSVGAGLRVSLSRHFSVSFDYGWQLIKTGLNSENRSSRGHVNAVFSW